MNKVKLHINNFKCFQDIDLGINNLTVFLGANAVGKSSVLQSLLLYLKAINTADTDGNSKISLFQGLGYDMGVVENLFNKLTKNNEIVISIDNTTLKIRMNDNDKSSDYVTAKIDRQQAIEYSYLCAERIGPRNFIEFHTDDTNCGIHGENTAYIISKLQQNEIDKNRSLNDAKESTMGTQLDNWLQFLFPGVHINVDLPFYKIAQLKVNAQNNQILPTHIGFGLSYSLPILVEGLRLPVNSWFIVENPEAHLQPKAQTQMGFFLAKMAAAGLRVIIETHSEHILKGIAAVVTPSQHCTEDISTIYIVERINNVPTTREVPLQRNGLASENFPHDFFDYGTEDVTKDAGNAGRLAGIEQYLY